MARVLGKSGRYVEDQAVKHAQRFVSYLMIAVAVCAMFSGFFFAVSFNVRKYVWFTLPAFCFTIALIFFAKKSFEKKIAAIERKNISFRKGAVGEAIISRVLEGLSADYTLINDISTDYGNIDAVVVGPTGIYAIDTKNWKGVVESDGNGELLLNGKPTTKPEVKNLVRTSMSCREQVLSLCKSRRLQTAPRIRAVFAFPSARVEAKWGSVRNADCVTDETLVDYIEKNRSNTRLSKEEIEIISRAFLSLARMDTGFPEADSTQPPAT